MNPSEEIEVKLIARLDEIAAEEEQLNRALVHLRGTADSTPPSPRRKPRSDKGKKRGPRKGS
jgi:hypothetical protein